MKETRQIYLETLKKQMLPAQYEQKSRDPLIELLKIKAAVLTVFSLIFQLPLSRFEDLLHRLFGVVFLARIKNGKR